MASALGWGAVAASSLVIGALAALARRWPAWLIGAVLGFGAGALISAVTFDLALEAHDVGSPGAGAGGLALGAVTYYTLDGIVGKLGAGSGLALGAFLDGIPEQMVLGLGLAGGEAVSLGLLGAIFVSNLPEAIGSSSAMLDAGRDRRQVLGLWIAVAALCVLASVAGYALGDVTKGDFQAAIDGFAAGALLVMLVDSMIPEAAERAGRPAGLFTVLGFALAAALSAVS